MVEELIRYISEGKEVRQSLSRLRAAIKEEDSYAEAVKLLGDGRVAADLLKDSDPKVRKNAAALLGDLGIKEQEEALFQAYEREEKRFIRSVYIKALAKTGGHLYLPRLKEQYEALISYEPKEEEKKHVAEELKALEDILRQDGENRSHTFCGWNEKFQILLTTVPSYGEVTGKQVEAVSHRSRVNKGTKVSGYNSLGVYIVTDHLKEILKIRTFRELLFPLTIKEEITVDAKPEEVGLALANSNLLELLKMCHKESAPFLFRLEIRNGMELKQRSVFAKKTAMAMEMVTGRKLLNSTSEYEFEIRLLPGKTGKLNGFLKMNTIPSSRFSYRKNAVSTSIHPSMAALFMELAAPYLKENAQILDPCCGVGTMLAERHQKVPAREIYGIDIFGDAIAGARENISRLNISANFIHKDFFDFTHTYLFDEIISNLPIRGKKSKEEQDFFYQRFFEKSKEHLKNNGIMVLYSNEAGFIKKQLRLHREFQLEKEFVIRGKDDFALYVIRFRG